MASIFPEDTSAAQRLRVEEILNGGSARLAPAPPLRNFLVAGVSSGVDQLQALSGRGLQAFGDAVGSAPIADVGASIAERNWQEAAANGRPDLEERPSLENWTDYPKWLGYQAAKQLPTLAASLAAARFGGARLAAGIPGAEAGIGRFAAGAVAAAPVAYPQAVGSLYEEAIAAGNQGPDAARSALMSGVPYAAMEGFQPAGLERILAKGLAGGMTKRFGTGAIIGAATETITEGVQTAMEQSYRPDLDAQQKMGNIIEGAITGGAVGGLFGGLGGVMGGRKRLQEVKNTSPANLSNDKIATLVDDVLGQKRMADVPAQGNTRPFAAQGTEPETAEQTAQRAAGLQSELVSLKQQMLANNNVEGFNDLFGEQARPMTAQDQARASMRMAQIQRELDIIEGRAQPEAATPDNMQTRMFVEGPTNNTPNASAPYVDVDSARAIFPQNREADLAMLNDRINRGTATAQDFARARLLSEGEVKADTRPDRGFGNDGQMTFDMRDPTTQDVMGEQLTPAEQMRREMLASEGQVAQIELDALTEEQKAERTKKADEFYGTSTAKWVEAAKAAPWRDEVDLVKSVVAAIDQYDAEGRALPKGLKTKAEQIGLTNADGSPRDITVELRDAQAKNAANWELAAKQGTEQARAAAAKFQRDTVKPLEAKAKMLAAARTRIAAEQTASQPVADKPAPVPMTPMNSAYQSAQFIDSQPRQTPVTLEQQFRNRSSGAPRPRFGMEEIVEVPAPAPVAPAPVAPAPVAPGRPADMATVSQRWAQGRVAQTQAEMQAAREAAASAPAAATPVIPASPLAGGSQVSPAGALAEPVRTEPGMVVVTAQEKARARKLSRERAKARKNAPPPTVPVLPETPLAGGTSFAAEAPTAPAPAADVNMNDPMDPRVQLVRQAQRAKLARIAETDDVGRPMRQAASEALAALDTAQPGGDAMAARVLAEYVTMTGDIAFQRQASSNRQPPLSDKQFDDALKAAVRKLPASAINAIRVVDTAEQLPAEVIEAARMQGMRPNQIRGVMILGEVFIVRNQISSEAQLNEVVAHEIFGHGGVRALFGDRRVAMLSTAWKLAGGMPGIQRIARQFGVLDKFMDYVPSRELTEADQADLVDELLAQAAGVATGKFKTALLAWVGTFKQMLARAANAVGLTQLAARLNTFDAANFALMMSQMREAVLAGQRMDGKHISFSQSQTRSQAFADLANAQRGKPEEAMREVQQVLGGGPLGSIVEQVGDLTHRMSEKFEDMQGSAETVLQKVNVALRLLGNKDVPLWTETLRNVENAAKAAGENADVRRMQLEQTLRDYAKAHSKLPVYNMVQKLARDAAVNIGQREFEAATARLEELKQYLDGGDYAGYAAQYNPTYDDYIYFVHGGSDFDQIDLGNSGRGEPGDFRPLGKGLYGYVIDPAFETLGLRAVNGAKTYSTKYGRGEKALHVFRIPRSVGGWWNGRQFLNTEHADRSSAAVQAERLPGDLIELALHQPGIAERIGKYALDTRAEKLIDDVYSDLNAHNIMFLRTTPDGMNETTKNLATVSERVSDWFRAKNWTELSLKANLLNLYTSSAGHIVDTFGPMFEREDGTNPLKEWWDANRMRGVAEQRIAHLVQVGYRQFEIVQRDDPKGAEKIGKLMNYTAYNIDPAKTWDEHTWLHKEANAPALQNHVREANRVYRDIRQNHAGAAAAYETFIQTNEGMHFAQQAVSLYNLMMMDDGVPESVKAPLRDNNPMDAYLAMEGTYDNPKASRDYWLAQVDDLVDRANVYLKAQRDLGSISDKETAAKIKVSTSSIWSRVQTIGQEKAAMAQSPYFHLGRFGDHVLSFHIRKDAKGNADPAAMDRIVDAFRAAGIEGIEIPADSTRANAFMRFENLTKMQEARRVAEMLAKEGVVLNEFVGKEEGEGDKRIKTFSREGEQASLAYELSNSPQWATDLMANIKAAEFGNYANMSETEKKLAQAMRGEFERHVTQYFMARLPDTAISKIMVHRNNVPGYSSDMIRSYLFRTQVGGRAVANLYAAAKMSKARAGMNAVANDARADSDTKQAMLKQNVVNELFKRDAQRPMIVRNNFIDTWRAYNHAYFLGMSPSYMAVNMTQLGVLLWPELAKRFSFVTSAKAIGKVTPMALKIMKAVIAEGGKRNWRDLPDASINREVLSKVHGLTPAQANFIMRVVNSGVIDIGSQSRELGRVVEGIENSKSENVLRWASAAGYYSEMTSRLIAALAARELHGGYSEETYKYVDETVRQSMLSYETWNQARATGRMGLAGQFTPVMTSFMQYTFQLTEKLYREMGRAFGKSARNDEERAGARKFLGAHLAAVTVLTGSLGLPMASVFAKVFDTLADWGDDEDEPWNIKASYRNWLNYNLGDGVGEVVARGLPRAFGIDISQRAGEQDMLPFAHMVSKLISDRGQWQDRMENWSLQTLGSPVSMVSNIVKGGGSLMAGDYKQGLTDIVPNAIKGPVKAYYLSQEGYVDKKGNNIAVDKGAMDVIWQALGFNPARKAEAAEVRGADASLKGDMYRKSARIRNALAQAVEAGDPDAIQEAVLEAQMFDLKNPDFQVLPTIASVVRSRANDRIKARMTGSPVGTDPDLADRTGFGNLD